MFQIERASAGSTAGIPKTVWALGLVSLFMDLSSEIIHALLPLFLTMILGVSVAMVGLIDGVAEATASISKVFSGYFSDRIGRRKPLILLGYGLGALSKPLFALAGSAPVVLGARFADRIGKGLRATRRCKRSRPAIPLKISAEEGLPHFLQPIFSALRTDSERTLRHSGGEYVHEFPCPHLDRRQPPRQDRQLRLSAKAFERWVTILLAGIAAQMIITG